VRKSNQSSLPVASAVAFNIKQNEATMKASKNRLENAIQLRDAALRILSRIGRNTFVANREGGHRHQVKQAKINGLTIMCSWVGHEQLLDIWKDGKVFSIAWNETRTPYLVDLVAFRPGNWQGFLLRADVEFTLASIECSPVLKRWLTHNGGTLR
jgi:hypothetical protein